MNEAVANCQHLIWLMDFTHMCRIYLIVFIFTEIWMKLFSITQI